MLLKINPHQPQGPTEDRTRIGLSWIRLPYPDTVFAYPPYQSCNSPTARP